MQQNVNPENDNDQSTQTNNTINHKILKIKGKPFWLNLTPNKRVTYSRFKTQSQVSNHIDDVQSDNYQNQQKINLNDDDVNSCAQSIQSFNQNYQEDFQSYKSTINRDKNYSDGKLPFFQGSKSHKKNLNLQISRLEISILKTPQKRQNALILKHKIADHLQKRQTNNSKTEPTQKQSDKFSVTREMFMNQSTLYLRNQNEKIIRKIQQFRKILPVIIKNDHEIAQQQIQINELKRQIDKILSVEYEFQLDESKFQIKVRQKQLEHCIKDIVSLKHDKKPMTFINDHTIIPPSKCAVLRQQLMNKIRLSCLRQEKNIQLTKKVQIYQEIIEKISAKSRHQSFHALQSRKSFLKWDYKRLRNEIDLKIIQEKVQIQSLKDQNRLVDLQIQYKNEILLKFPNSPFSGVKIEIQESEKSEQKSQNNEEFQLIEQKDKAVRTFVFKKKKLHSIQSQTKNTQKKVQTNDPLNFQKQKNRQQHLSILPSPSLSQVNKIKVNSFEKQQSLRRKKQLQQCNRNLNIRIKKSIFRNQDVSQELEELKI